MRHAFLETTSNLLSAQSIATFRYEFPYMAKARRRPDAPRLLMETVVDAVDTARRNVNGIPLLAGGKSLGGRMTSRAAAETGLAGVDGLVFLGFPLHPPGKPGTSRADHLSDVNLPMLFIQGTRDALADLELMRPLCDKLGERATLHIIEAGDHSFKVLKRSGRKPGEVMDEIATTIKGWIAKTF